MNGSFGRYSWVLIAVVLLGLLAGCKSGKGPRFDARGGYTTLTNLTPAGERVIDVAALRQQTNRFRLGPGDAIEVEILNTSDARRETHTVGPDGKIYFFLLPGLDVWGLTLQEARDLIQSELSQYINSPQVALRLQAVKSQRVWVLGRVEQPGLYSLMGPTRLLEALAAAGGVLTSSESGTSKELADLRHSFVIREGERLPVDFHRLLQEGDMAQNLLLQPDDFIYLPSSLAQEVYVLGAVRSPRALHSEGRLTLASAIAQSGGTLKNAHGSHVAIVRGSLSDPHVAVVDYTDIIKGNAPDVLLEPRDIVYVPLSPYRILTRYVDLILTTFVRSVAINEGARAVSEDAGRVSVGINISPNMLPPSVSP